ncbi:MAG: hypothetical protein HQM01_03250 [Magnetococcales bacterium]|nr:hypothetical protein [Magnetococcales bacterium]
MTVNRSFSPHWAQNMPLVHVAPFDVVRHIITATSAGASPSWQVTRDGVFARNVQIDSEWERCVYFYAGLAKPEYGDMAFVHASSMETGKTGHAAPCDTGGVYAGKCHPFRLPDGSPIPHLDAVAFLMRNDILLTDWRAAFDSYLTDYFALDLNDYLEKRAPNSHDHATWGDPRLPARDLKNFLPGAEPDWPSWAWEVRIEESVPLEDGLLIWVAMEDRNDLLRDLFTTKGSGAYHPVRIPEWIDRMEVDVNFAEAIKEWIQKWLQPKPWNV